MASHLVQYAVLGTALQPPTSEVIEAVTSSYPPRVQKLFVTSNIKTTQNAIEGQHHNPQQWSDQKRPHSRSSYGRQEHGWKNGRSKDKHR